jgi:hypothetical protein
MSSGFTSAGSEMISLRFAGFSAIPSFTSQISCQKEKPVVTTSTGAPRGYLRHVRSPCHIHQIPHAGTTPVWHPYDTVEDRDEFADGTS